MTWFFWSRVRRRDCAAWPGQARGFAFHPALAARLPGLAGEAFAEKRFADVDGLFPGRQVDCCRAVMLLFPRVVDAAASLIERLAPTEALMALLPASGGILAGGAPGQSQAQLTALGGLVATVPAPARGDLDREYIDSSARALARYHELGALLGRLGEAEIPVIALKGVYSPRRSTRSRGCVP